MWRNLKRVDSFQSMEEKTITNLPFGLFFILTNKNVSTHLLLVTHTQGGSPLCVWSASGPGSGPGNAYSKWVRPEIWLLIVVEQGRLQLQSVFSAVSQNSPTSLSDPASFALWHHAFFWQQPLGDVVWSLIDAKWDRPLSQRGTEQEQVHSAPSRPVKCTYKEQRHKLLTKTSWSWSGFTPFTCSSVRRRVCASVPSCHCGVSSSLSITAWCAQEKPACRLFTFVYKVLGLQVEAFPVTLPPEPGDGGVKLPTAVRLHGRRCGQEVPLPPDESTSIWAATFPLQALWRHLEGEVVGWNVDVPRVVSLVGIVFTPLPMSPRVGLVPIIGADRHGEQPQRTERQEEPCAC